MAGGQGAAWARGCIEGRFVKGWPVQFAGCMITQAGVAVARVVNVDGKLPVAAGFAVVVVVD